MITNSASPQKSEPAVAINDVRGSSPFGIKTETLQVSRAKYLAALSKEGSANAARLIEIYQRGKSAEQLKEYRLLDVQPESVYDLLGLEHADIIVATDGYIVPTPQMFWSYLNLIGKFDEGNIEVRRLDQPLLLNFKFNQ